MSSMSERFHIFLSMLLGLFSEGWCFVFFFHGRRKVSSTPGERKLDRFEVSSLAPSFVIACCLGSKSLIKQRFVGGSKSKSIPYQDIPGTLKDLS